MPTESATRSDDALARLAAVIESRLPAHGGDPDKSYVARLLHRGPDAFLKKIEADGTWARLWTVTIGQRTGSTHVPTPPPIR